MTSINADVPWSTAVAASCFPKSLDAARLAIFDPILKAFLAEGSILRKRPESAVANPEPSCNWTIDGKFNQVCLGIFFFFFEFLISQIYQS